jgi:hypothetical protein
MSQQDAGGGGGGGNGGAEPSPGGTAAAAEGGRADIYTHAFTSDMYAMAWSVRPDQPFRLAAGSFVEAAAGNFVEVIQLSDTANSFVRKHRCVRARVRACVRGP